MSDDLSNKLAKYAHVPTMVAVPQLSFQRSDGTTVGVTLVGLPVATGCQLNDGLTQRPGKHPPGVTCARRCMLGLRALTFVLLLCGVV